MQGNYPNNNDYQYNPQQNQYNPNQYSNQYQNQYQPQFQTNQQPYINQQYPNQQYPNQYPNYQESFLTYENENQFDMSKTNVRLNFIKKVYMILSTQLFVTAAYSGIIMYNESLQQFMMKQLWLFFVAIGVNIFCSYALICYQSCARTVPRNFILLGLFTLSEAYFVGAICAMSDPKNVFIALAITTALVIGLSIYAFTTKTDFTMMGGTLFMLLAVLMCASILSIFFRSKILEIAISGFSVFVFGFYLIYDTQLLVGDQSRQLSVDDYIVGALMLYIDIIRIFLEILNILNELSNN